MDKFDVNKISQLENIISTLEQENTKLKREIEAFKQKEQSISNAIIASMEHANQLEASRKKLYLLDIQRSRLMYLRMEQVINELYRKYPEIRKDTKLREMSDKFRTMVFNDLSEANKNINTLNAKKTAVDDPIKKLLHNIIDCFDSKKTPTPIVNKLESYQTTQNLSTSGFDLNEALHPTMGLDEIMKAFNLDDKDDKKDKK